MRKIYFAPTEKHLAVFHDLMQGEIIRDEVTSETPERFFVAVPEEADVCECRDEIECMLYGRLGLCCGVHYNFI